jgi:hypothetical protein
MPVCSSLHPTIFQMKIVHLLSRHIGSYAETLAMYKQLNHFSHACATGHSAILFSEGGCGSGGCGAVNALTVSTAASSSAATSLADVATVPGLEHGVIPTPEAAAAFVNASVANNTGKSSSRTNDHHDKAWCISAPSMHTAQRPLLFCNTRQGMRRCGACASAPAKPDLIVECPSALQERRLTTPPWRWPPWPAHTMLSEPVPCARVSLSFSLSRSQ